MKRTSAFRPCLEPLEDRFLLAACHVIRLGDLNAGFDLGNGHARGDLRYCINFANNNPGPDTIDFSVTGAIKLTNSLPKLTSDITMTGPGANLLAVDGNGPNAWIGPIFRIEGTVSISGITITNGYGDQTHGGIRNDGTLTLKDSTVSNNRYMWTYYGGNGAGIGNAGNLTISGSTISGNSFYNGDNDCKGAGIRNYSSAVLSIVNSTISGNFFETIKGYGAGIYNEGSLDIRHSTITNNKLDSGYGGSGSGIYNAGPPVYLYNTIVAGNINGADKVGSNTGSSNLIGGNPKLGVLQYNGGHTQTHKVLQMSPALNAGDNTGAPQWDQRGPGFPRVVNGTIDIGAFEVQATGAPTAPDFRALLITAELEKDY